MSPVIKKMYGKPHALIKSRDLEYRSINEIMFMPPTLKKLEGHIAFGLSVCLCVCVSVCVLTFEW